jgi:undecaprenyl-phosphate 4-deoxy-4-formamido-L-arabinose transferase
MSRNYGQHAALLFGIRAARYAITATMDDDLQHPPTELPKLLAKLDEGYDVVYGSPQNEQYSNLWRKMATNVTKFTLRSVGVKLAGDVSAFRVFRTELRDAFARYQSPFVSIDALLTWGTTRFGLVPVSFGQRRYGQSNYTFSKLAGHTLNMMTGFSTVPLRFASLIGFAFTLVGLALLVYVVGRLLIEDSVPGFPFLASSIAIFSGAQLFTIGIIGEYLARMHIRSMGRPAGHVRRSVGFGLSSASETQQPDETVAVPKQVNIP